MRAIVANVDMSRALFVLSFAIVLPLIAVVVSRNRRIDVYDGFETAELSRVWETNRLEPGALTMQSNVARAGHGAAKIVVHSRDIFEKGINGSADTERAELTEAESLYAKQDVPYEYSFSMFIPSDFLIVPTRLVIAQWKQECGGNEKCSDDSPVLAVRYISGVLRITQKTGRMQTTLFETGEDVRGKWTDFRFQNRFSPGASGSVKAWINGKPVVNYAGPTAYAENAGTGYRSPSPFYFKMGLYRDVMAEPMTIYIDEYRKKQLP